MSKVICEICGTSYPETAEQCPICGYTRELSAALAEEIQTGEVPAPQAAAPVKGGKFSASNVRKRNKSTPPYEVESPQEPEEDSESFEYDEQPRESSAVLVVLLVVVIAALLAVTGYIGFKYVLPNVLPEETSVPTVTTEATTVPEETEAPTIPCTNLVLTSGGTVELEKEGQYWLLNVVILPVDSTDVLSYESSDESVATVNSEGRVTAVATGEAVITIRCGEQALECRIICSIPEETTVPETTEEIDETGDGEESTEPETT